MDEYQEIANWLSDVGGLHDVPLSASLPDPCFEMGNRRMVSFSTNNYLALAKSKGLIEAAQSGLSKYGVGNCESRLLGGDIDLYRQLEQRLCEIKKKDSALLFATGYLTNLGVLSSLVRSSLILRFYGFRPTKRYKYAYFSDEFNHISIREGIRLSEAERRTYRHLDLDHLEAQLRTSDAHTKIIVSDGVFSQDGDIAPLPELLSLANRYDALLYIDDAHGTGVLGTHGQGIAEHFNCYDPRIIHMGTLSKAYGAIGGFVALDRRIGENLRLTCPAYGFTSTLPPDQVLAVLAAIDIVRNEPDRRVRLWTNQAYLAAGLENLGYELVSKQTPILPVVIGDERRTDFYQEALCASGFHVDSVKFPAVRLGKARLRFIANANHTTRQIDDLLEVMRSLGEGTGKMVV